MSDDIILAAVRLAAEAHKDTKRKFSGKPYLLHPLRVMGRVAAHPGASCFEVAASVLHDAWEDPPHIPLERIERQIHPKVAGYVSNLTSPSKALVQADGRYPKEWPRHRRAKLNCEHIHGCDYWSQTMKGYDRHDNLDELLQDIHGFSGRPTKDFLELYCDESSDLAVALDKVESWQREELRKAISVLRFAAATM